MKIGSDITGLQQGLNAGRQSIASFAQSATKSGAMLTLGVTAPIAMVGKASLDMAMEAVESENLFSVSMGNMADSTRKWSEEVQKSMGLNGYELRKNVALFNTMSTAAGLTEKAALDLSKNTVMLSHDMASFFNVAQSDALQDLKAILTGEAEPMKKYGVLMGENAVKAIAYSQGIARQGEKLTEVQKIQARYALVMKATAKAQGDLARTIDSPTNQLRVLKEQLGLVQTEFGMKLIPVLLTFLEVIRPVVEWLTKLNDTQMTIIIGILALVAAVGPLTTLFGILSGVVAALLSPFGLAAAAVMFLLGTFVGWDSVIGTFKSLLAGVGVAVSQVLVGDFQGASTTIYNLMTNLFGTELTNAVFTGVTAMFDTISTFWEDTKTGMTEFGGELVKFWNKHKDDVVGVLSLMWNNLVSIFSIAYQLISTTTTNWFAQITEFWKAHGESIMTIVTILWETLSGIVTTWMTLVIEFLQGAWDNIALIIEGATDIILGIIGLFFSILDGDWRAAWDAFIQIIDGAMKIVGGIFGLAIDSITLAAKSIINVVQNIIEGVLKAIGNFIQNSVNTAINAINGLIDKFNSMLSLKLPDWAGGGSIGISVPHIPNVGGGSSPIIPTGSGSSGGGNKPIVNNVYLDGKKISSSVDKHLGSKVTMQAN